MKRLLIVTILLTSMFTYGQKLISPTKQYEQDMNREGEERLFNDKMLNILFANKVGTSFGGSNDLAMQKFFASIDASDNSLSIGVNVDTQAGNELKKKIWLLSAGAKIKSDNKFATIYEDGDFQEDDIGINFKATWIGRGIINFRSNDEKNREQAIKANRFCLYEKYDNKTEKFNESELSNFIDKQSVLSIFDNEITSVEKQLEKKHEELYAEMAKEEVDYLEKNKMYHWIWDHWASIEVFAPLGENTYKVTNDKMNKPLAEKTFYAFTATISYTSMWEFSGSQSFLNASSIFLKGRVNLKNNNNIIADDVSSKVFQTTTVGADNNIIIDESNNGYIIDYQQFLTPSIVIEPAFFAFNNTVGFSPAMEFNMGKYSKTNWKLGIPVSLKDKEGKPKINFELQWKEINTFDSSVHLVGISANFLFGQLIN